MQMGVVFDRVPLDDGAAPEGRRLLQLRPDGEEGDLDALVARNVERAAGQVRVPAVVERDEDIRLRGVPVANHRRRLHRIDRQRAGQERSLRKVARRPQIERRRDQLGVLESTRLGQGNDGVVESLQDHALHAHRRRRRRAQDRPVAESVVGIREVAAYPKARRRIAGPRGGDSMLGLEKIVESSLACHLEQRRRADGARERRHVQDQTLERLAERAARSFLKPPADRRSRDCAAAKRRVGRGELALAAVFNDIPEVGPVLRHEDEPRVALLGYQPGRPHAQRAAEHGPRAQAKYLPSLEPRRGRQGAAPRNDEPCSQVPPAAGGRIFARGETPSKLAPPAARGGHLTGLRRFSKAAVGRRLRRRALTSPRSETGVGAGPLLQAEGMDRAESEDYLARPLLQAKRGVSFVSNRTTARRR